jgi:hypothetical protein
MRVAFDEFPQRSFESAFGAEKIGAAEIGLGQIEQVVDIPVHAFETAREQVACA